MFTNIVILYLFGIAITCDFISYKVVREKEYQSLAHERRKVLVTGILFFSLFWFIFGPYLYWKLSENKHQS